MRSIVKKIDRAIKKIYNLELFYKAEDFLVRTLSHISEKPVKIGNRDFHGTLFVEVDPMKSMQDDVYLAIYFNKPVQEVLSEFPRNPTSSLWSHEQLKAFSVATEEVSHFNYLLHHATSGRQVTQLELELQGEIDKFFVTFFAKHSTDDKKSRRFKVIFDQMFVHFHFAEQLTEAQRERYLEANNLAKRFIRKCERYLTSRNNFDKCFRLLRKFYRLNSAEKISLINSD